MRDRPSGERYGSCPRIMAVPDVGSMSPRKSFIAVLLPAPLGPSSPVTPSPTSKDTPSKATVRP